MDSARRHLRGVHLCNACDAQRDPCRAQQPVHPGTRRAMSSRPPCPIHPPRWINTPATLITAMLSTTGYRANRSLCLDLVLMVRTVFRRRKRPRQRT